MSWWQKLKQRLLASPAPPNSAMLMARMHGLDRRRFARVSLPATTVHLFPTLAFNEIPLPIIDLSIGGARVQDPKSLLVDQIGQSATLTLAWPELSEVLQVKIVASSRHIHRHLQFLNLSPGSLARMSILVRSGTAGQKLRLASNPRMAPVQLAVVELWTGINGDSLMFFDKGEKIAELTSLARTYSFFPQLPPRVASVATPERSRPAMAAEVADALACLVNIGEPSPRLQRLIEMLTTRPDQWVQTGSGI